MDTFGKNVIITDAGGKKKGMIEILLLYLSNECTMTQFLSATCIIGRVKSQKTTLLKILNSKTCYGK